MYKIILSVNTATIDRNEKGNQKEGRTVKILQTGTRLTKLVTELTSQTTLTTKHEHDPKDQKLVLLFFMRYSSDNSVLLYAIKLVYTACGNLPTSNVIDEDRLFEIVYSTAGAT